MKNVVITVILSMVVTPSFAQKNEKFATFGFNGGINRSNLSFSSQEVNGDNITNDLGYRFGLISNFQITKRISLAPKAELSFGSSAFSSTTENLVSPNNLEILGHLKYKLRKGSLSPYIIVGPNFRIPILGANRDDLIPTKKNVALDIGFGLDLPIFKYRISPEIRYSFGLMDINSDASVTDMKYHNIALVLNLSGRK
ncbi:MAG: PorT family protein [Crocinitomicaceae bacterium]|nr:PorT family protein [Crocinitomicaceae bacterium]